MLLKLTLWGYGLQSPLKFFLTKLNVRGFDVMPRDSCFRCINIMNEDVCVLVKRARHKEHSLVFRVGLSRSYGTKHGLPEGSYQQPGLILFNIHKWHVALSLSFALFIFSLFVKKTVRPVE